MHDLRAELRAADAIPAPDLWPEIARRARAREITGPSEPRHWLMRMAILAPLAAAVALAAVVVSASFSSGTAAALISEAQQRFATIGAFRARITLTIPAGLLADEMQEDLDRDVVIEREVVYSGVDRWRRTTLSETGPVVIDGGAGSFWVWDGTHLGVYRADTNDYYEQDVAAGYDPLGALSWESAPWQERCENGERLSNERVAGRDAWHIDCGEEEVWVDAETGLLLRTVIHDSHGETTDEVTDIDYGASPDSELFLPSPPPGANTDPASAATSLERGSRAPTWQLPLLAGGELALQDLRGSTAALYFWAEWCPCYEDFALLQQLDADSPGGVRVVTVAISSTPDALAEILRQQHAEFGVVVDDGTIGDTWGVSGVPLLVLLDADGVVTDITLPPDIGRVLEALALDGP